MEYSIYEHKHRFAAWAAGRAASVNTCRFTVETGKELLEAVFVDEKGTRIQIPEQLPKPDAISTAHKKWRKEIVRLGKTKHGLVLTHGIAAKLLNVYTKAVFVCGGHYEHPCVQALHPPIDSLLLEALKKHDFSHRELWRKAGPWSKFGSDKYSEIIKGVQEVCAEYHLPGLWGIEFLWRGFR